MSAQRRIQAASEPVLVVSDADSEARFVSSLLTDDFGDVATSSDPQLAATDFTTRRPRVLVLAFNTLQKAADYYLALHKQVPLIHELPHRTVLLCSREDVRHAYDLCRKGQFDDYVLFWPMTFDQPRLHMAVHCALQDLDRDERLKSALAEHAATGDLQLADAEDSLQDAEKVILLAVDNLCHKLAGGHPSPGQVAARAHTRGEIAQRLESLSTAMNSLRGWAESIESDIVPLARVAEPARVLIIEDDPFQQKLLKFALAELQAHLVFTGDGATALASLQDSSPDLILMDLELPDIDGLELTRRIRQIERYANVPVIVLTGHSAKERVIESKACGALDFIRKPFEKGILLAKLRQGLSGMAQARALNKAA